MKLFVAANVYWLVLGLIVTALSSDSGDITILQLWFVALTVFWFGPPWVAIYKELSDDKVRAILDSQLNVVQPTQLIVDLATDLLTARVEINELRGSVQSLRVDAAWERVKQAEVERNSYKEALRELRDATGDLVIHDWDQSSFDVYLRHERAFDTADLLLAESTQ